MGVIRYSARLNKSKVLGPGTRAVLWVHGCCFNCAGCISQDFRNGDSLVATSRQLADWFMGLSVNGITISGGEPMLQAASLAEMVRLIRERVDCGVIVYTGFSYSVLEKAANYEPGVRCFLDEIDLLIDGQYVQELNDGRPYVGSSNQRVIPLTERYVEELHSYYVGVASRQIEIHLSKMGTLMVGVPSREQSEVWQRLKQLGDRNDC